MPATTVVFPDYAFKAYLTSAELNSKLNALKEAINDHASDIDGIIGTPAVGGGVYITPQDYGAIADGLSHPLSSRYGSLAAAQVDYPFATSLTQEIDYCALKAMSDDALGAYTLENAFANAKLNKPMFIHAGTYVLGNDTWLIRNTVAMIMHGAGRLATTIVGNGVVLAFDGLWYSEISGICFNVVGAGIAAVELDGNIPGHPYATRGSQANTFKDCLFQTLFTNQYCFTMNRQGSSGAQGSENLFINCHFFGSNTACYYQLGFNALNNTFIGGNFQGYSKNGIQLDTGHINVYSVGFQSTFGYTQIINDGWDISAQGSGVTDKISIQGCRTESLRFLKALGSTPVDVRTITHNPGTVYAWTAGAAVSLNQHVLKTSPSGIIKLYRVTTAGVSGGAEPAWPNSGTVADGTAVWTQTDYSYIEIENGSIDFTTVRSPVDGRLINRTNYWQVEKSTSYTLKPWETVVAVDATAGPMTITIPADEDEQQPIGTEILIKRYDNSANLVTVVGASGVIDFDFTGNAPNIPGGSRGWVRLTKMGGGAFTRRWMVTGKG